MTENGLINFSSSNIYFVEPNTPQKINLKKYTSVDIYIQHLKI